MLALAQEKIDSSKKKVENGLQFTFSLRCVMYGIGPNFQNGFLPATVVSSVATCGTIGDAHILNVSNTRASV